MARLGAVFRLLFYWLVDFKQLRQPKIQDFGWTLIGKEYGGGLDIAMNDSFVMSRLQPIAGLDCYPEQFVERQLSLAEGRQAIPEGLASQQLHNDDGLAFVLFNFVDCADIGVV